MKISIFS